MTIDVRIYAIGDAPDDVLQYVNNNGLDTDEHFNVLVIRDPRNNHILNCFDDCIEREDATFIRDLSWIQWAIEHMYDRGFRDGYNDGEDAGYGIGYGDGIRAGGDT